jgi:hypothetical protein
MFRQMIFERVRQIFTTIIGSEGTNFATGVTFRRFLLLRCQILGGAIHEDFIVVRTFARNAQQNRDRVMRMQVLVG